MIPKPINPPGLPKPSGFSHGMLFPGGRILFVAGQTAAGADGKITTDDFVEQFEAALGAVRDVVAGQKGKAENIGSMTIFVTSIEEYQRCLKPLGNAYRRRMGRHYPAMAMVEVSRLVHPRAKVEIQAMAVLE